MDKRIKNIVPFSQQEITTTVEKEDGEYTFEIRACSALDDHLREDFHADLEGFGPEEVIVNSRTDYSNQGNELAQVVTVTFQQEERVEAMQTINEIVKVSKEFYNLQLARNLNKDRVEEDSEWHNATQLQFVDEDDEELIETCLLYRGTVNFG